MTQQLMEESHSTYRWPELPPLSLVRMLWKRKRLIAAIWFLASTVAAVIVITLPAIYRAEALILVESQRIPERFVSSTVNTDLNVRLTNLSQRILSYSILLGLVEKFNLYPDERRSKVEEEIVDLMRRDIKVRLEQGWGNSQPGAFRISYEGPGPEVVAQVANRLAELFIDENLRSREVYASGTSEFLVNQVAEAKKRLEEQEAKVSEYKRQYNGELPQQESRLAAALERLQLQLQGVQEAISRAQQERLAQENALHAARASQDALSQITEQLAASGTANSGAAQVNTEAAQLEKEIALLRAKYTDEHPDVRKAREALVRLRERQKPEAAQGAGGPRVEQQVASNGPSADKKRVTTPGIAMLDETLVRERERVEHIKSLQALAAKQIDHLNAERQRILRQIESVQARLQQLPLREQQLVGITRDYETSKANYQSLLDKKLSAEMAAEMEKRQKSERFTLLDPARVPEKPVKPERLLLSLYGSAIGLVLAFAITFLREFNQNVLLGEWELPKGTPILGRVPRIVVRAPQARRSLEPAKS